MKFETVHFKHLLSSIEKPSRYIGNEINTFKKKPSNKTINFCLAFPEVYEVGVSHLGLKILYSILNNENDALADRVYCPWPDFGELLKTQNLPLFGIESKIDIKDFDFICFTLQSELTYTNILYMLDISEIPFRSVDRDDNFPLLIAGGPSGANPEPVAPFFDAILLGDGEEAIIEIKEVYKQCKDYSKKEILEALSSIEGLYIPSLKDKQTANNKKIKSRKFLEFNNFALKHLNQIIPWQQAVHDRYVSEIMRGCTRGCRFCHAGYHYRPVREIDPKIASETIISEVKKFGWEEVALTSLSSSDYSQIKPLLSFLYHNLKAKGSTLSLPSLRVDSLDDELVKILNDANASGLTIAPEAGSQKLRDVINKNITEEDILHGVRIAFENGWKLIKLYFMIGLPLEDETDIDAIIKLVEKIIVLSKRKLKINITLSPFVPKPFTPFQWAKLLPKDEVLKRAWMIKNGLSQYKFVKIRYHIPELSVLESISSRGDQSVADLIEEAYRNGAIYDGWDEFFDFAKWQLAADNLNFDLNKFTDKIDTKSNLYWDFIDSGVTKQFLLSEWEKAKNIEVTEDCRTGSCSICGVCDSKVKNTFAENNLPIIEEKKQTKITNDFHHYRVFYEKVGELQFVAHLDLLRMVHRLLNASDIPLAYSQGFNPHPKVSFGPPLSIGIQGINEFFDVALNQKVDSTYFLKKLKESFDENLNIKSVTYLSNKGMRNINAYQFEEILLSPPPTLIKSFSERIQKFHEAEKWDYTRERKGKIKTIDLKNIIYNLEYDNGKVLIRKKLTGANIFNIIQEVFKIPREESGNIEIIRLNLLKK